MREASGTVGFITDAALGSGAPLPSQVSSDRKRATSRP